MEKQISELNNTIHTISTHISTIFMLFLFNIFSTAGYVSMILYFDTMSISSLILLSTISTIIFSMQLSLLAVLCLLNPVLKG